MTDKVTQADRDAMADILQSWDLLSGLTIEHIRLGRYDADPAFKFLPRTNTELVEALREAAEAMEYAAGCDEGVDEDTAASEIMSWAGPTMFVAYTNTRKALSLYGDER